MSDAISRRNFLAGVGSVGASSLLLACGGGSSGPGGGTKTFSKGKGVPKKPTELVVRSWGPPYSTALQKSAGAKFTKETGIKIRIDLTDFAPTQVNIRQALASGQRPPVDILHTLCYWAQQAEVQRLTQELDPALVPNIKDLLPVALPPSKSNAWVDVYTYTLPIIYRPDKIDLPKSDSWQGIFEPQYKKTFLASTTVEVLSTPFAKVLGIDMATDPMDKVWDMVRDLRPSIGLTGQDQEFIQGMKTGQVRWGAQVTSDAQALKDDGMKVKMWVPKEGVTLSADAMYVPRGLPDNVTYWAQKFINTVLDPAVQTDYCGRLAAVPTNKHGKPLASMVGQPAFPFTENEIEKYGIPVAVEPLAKNLDKWQASYTAALQH